MDVLRMEVIKTGFFTWLSDLIKSRSGSSNVPLSGDIFSDPEFQSIAAECHIRDLAFSSAINLIANSISKCEFKTYVNGVETKGPEYYLFNVEPNKNQNSSAFIHKWIHHLLWNNECLIIENGGQLLVADSFRRKPYALFEDVFSEVTVGDFKFDRTFQGSEVLYFEYSTANMRQLINSMYHSYSKLLEYAQRAYQKSRSTKGTMSFSTLAQGDPDFQKRLDDMINNKLKRYFSADNAVLPVFDGWKYEEQGNKTYSNESTRDIRALIDDVFDFTAKSLSIPPALLRGDIAGLKDAKEMYLSFCIDPLVDMCQEEVNRKRSGRQAFLKGTYLKIDTRAIMHIDLLNVSTAIDKLIGSGVFCVNDILKLLGEEALDEPWAKQHWMTKNYSRTEDLLDQMTTQANGGGGG